MLNVVMLSVVMLSVVAPFLYGVLARCRNIGRHDPHRNDIQANDAQHKGLICDTQHDT